MSNITVKSRPSGIILKIFIVLLLAVMGFGKVSGLLDEYHLGRFLMFSIIGIWAWIYVFPRKSSIQINVFDLLFLSYLGLNYISLFWANLPSAGFLTVQGVCLSFSFYLGFRLLHDRLDKIFVFSCIAIMTLAFLFATGWELLSVGLSEGLSGDHIYEIIGMSGHKNLTASFLFLLLGLNVYGLQFYKNKKWIYALIMLQVIIMLLLRSRAVMLAMAALLCCIFLFLMFLQNKKYDLKIWWKAIIVVVSIGVISFVTFNKLGGSKADIAFMNPANFLKSGTGSERAFVWYKTTELIKDKWWTGYGVGNWKLIFPSKSIGGGFRLQSQNVTFTRVHNDFLEIFSELGIIGILIYLTMFLVLIRALIHGIRSESGREGLSYVVLLGTILGYMVIAFFDFPKERFEHQILLSFIFAIIVYRQEVFLSNMKVSRFINTPGLRYLSFMIPFLQILNLPLSYFQMKGEIHIRKSLGAQTANDWPIMAKEAQMAYSEFFKVAPTAFSPKWMEGLGYYQQAMYDKANTELKNAFKDTPYHFQTINDYAGCLVKLQKYDEAIDAFERALFINPKYEDAMFNLSYVYAQKGDYDKAVMWANKTEVDIQKRNVFLIEIEKLRGK